MALSIRWRWKLDRFLEQLKGLLGAKKKEDARPRLCPACSTLVGASATKCYQCGASMTFSLAAASRSLGGLIHSEAPITYGILFACCLLYGLSLLVTIRISGGFAAPSGGLFGLFGLGGVNGQVLMRLGASLPLPLNLQQPWRFVMAVFLHGSLLHLAFNMWVLLDVGPQIEELYGSARYFFIYVVTGVAGYCLSSFFFRTSVGASGALLGLIGVLLALTTGRRSAGMQMLRSQLIKWLIYIAVIGFVFPQIDNFAHAGGFVAGYALGKIMSDRQPVDAVSRKRAYALGWATALVVAVSFVMMLFQYFRTS
ncbi:MAG: rhomboid family intramembrane serine protease [Candidatus Acidiferrales bacterium]